MIKILVRLGVSAGLLYFVLRSIDLAALWLRVQTMNPAWLVLALAVYAAQQMIGAWRWNRLLQAQHIDVEKRRLAVVIVDRARGTGVVAAIFVIAMPQIVSYVLAPARALNQPWITERAQRLEDAVLRFGKAPGALAGAFGAALVVQITIVAFCLLTAQALAVPLPIPVFASVRV